MKKLLAIIISFLSYFTFAQTGADCSSAILVSSSGCSAATAYNNTGIICANSDGTYTPTRVVGPTGPAGTCI